MTDPAQFIASCFMLSFSSLVNFLQNTIPDNVMTSTFIIFNESQSGKGILELKSCLNC